MRNTDGIEGLGAHKRRGGVSIPRLQCSDGGAHGRTKGALPQVSLRRECNKAPPCVNEVR